MEVGLSERTRFEELVLPHLDAGYNLARWLTRSSQDAEDVVQEACARALKYFVSLRGNDARAWFLTIVRHASYDWCKRNRPAEMIPDDGTTSELAVDPAAIDPEQAALRSAESRSLAKAVAQLPLAFREVLILRELEDLSVKDAKCADLRAAGIGKRDELAQIRAPRR